jgi:hypothetical protein
MARIRTIKPEFWTDIALMECSLNARLLFIGTWNFADDAGNLDRSAKQIKARVFPGDTIDCEPLLRELLVAELLIEYSVSGKNYLHVPGFTKHQVINRPSKPQCPDYEDSLRVQGGLTLEGKGREGRGVEGKGDSPRSRSVPSKVASPENQTPTENNKTSVVLSEGTGENLEIDTAGAAARRATWEGYSEAYTARYSVAPVRNHKSNSLIKQFVTRLGHDESPGVARFFLSHNNALYVRSKHALDLMIRDAEGLRTEWARGRTVTNAEAEQADRTQANVNVWGGLIDKAERERAALPAEGNGE